jgi:hypothetical protein
MPSNREPTPAEAQARKILIRVEQVRLIASNRIERASIKAGGKKYPIDAESVTLYALWASLGAAINQIAAVVVARDKTETPVDAALARQLASKAALRLQAIRAGAKAATTRVEADPDDPTAPDFGVDEA